MYEPCTLAAAELQSLHVLLYYIRILTTCTLSDRIYATRDDVIIKETSYKNQRVHVCGVHFAPPHVRMFLYVDLYIMYELLYGSRRF